MSKLETLAHIPIGMLIPREIQERLDVSTNWYNSRRGVFLGGIAELLIGITSMGSPEGDYSLLGYLALGIDCMRLVSGVVNRFENPALEANDMELKALEGNLLIGKRSSLVTEIPYWIYTYWKERSTYQKQLKKEINELTT